MLTDFVCSSNIDSLTNFVNSVTMVEPPTVEQKEARVIVAATQVFMRYGYRRATMGDIAGAARISRPALYLIFSSKEEILTAVLVRVFNAALEEIRHGLESFAGAEEKLNYAFDVWCVRPFELILASPDAKDLLQSSYEFASEVTSSAAANFEALLADVIQPLIEEKETGEQVNEEKASNGFSAAQIAHILATAVPGFKESAQTVLQFRELIAGLIAIVITSLNVRRGMPAQA